MLPDTTPHTRLWAITLILITPALAGCLGGAGDATGGSVEDPAIPQMAMAVKRFLPNGTLLPGVTDDDATPRYVYTGTGHVGAEPNIGITSSGTIFTTAWDETLRSRDGGHTWESVHSYTMAQGQTGIGSGDPMLWVDTVTDRVWVNHMYFREYGVGSTDVTTGCFTMLWSDDEGESWTQRDGACVTPRVDHQKVVAGPPGPEPNPMADGAQHPSVVYTCYNNRLQTESGGEPQTTCIMSYDGGLTYPLQTHAFDGSTDCGGTAGHPALAPDGTIVVPAAYNCGPELAISRDSGMTWTVRDVPEGEGATYSMDPDVAFDADGTLYFMWRDGDHMTRVARSDDLGQTWTGPWNATVPGLTSTRFHALSAGADGRVAMAYLGTNMARGTTWTDDEGHDQTWQGDPGDAPPETHWHLHVVTLEDDGNGAPVLTGRQVTPNDDPVQKGCTSLYSGERACRNMLDFIDTAIGPDGTFYVSYTEGCTVRDECAGNADTIDEMDARDSETAVAWLEGWSLLH